ncbi:MAG TPA: phosphoribosylformylglycinamidine cyclo-ligase [Candidatus Atribacteria bacterium]|nr:phosphoribosylformylglycinamidine cyclo-ligase [Candidatus Atribacteria bacterium]HCU21893.1 phosphoribosylformylglycinamidine cyclo-ligase [Candidatus Atribacteria bacterium]
MTEGWTYQKAGVNVDLANTTVEKIKNMVQSTRRSEVIADIGGFSGIFCMGEKGKNHPCLVASTDGVGTKLKIAIHLGIHDSIGIDLVAMCVNDILCTGAEPWFFLDYFACGKLHSNILERVISGIVQGCQLAGCALLGGETAEMPGMYQDNDYDLAGFAVGSVLEDRLIDGQSIQNGDGVIALASSGLHSNGFSLVRKVLDWNHIQYDQVVGDLDLAQELLKPTRIYVKSILKLLQEVSVRGIAHITGGGIVENVPRILPQHHGVSLFKNEMYIPEIFSFLQKIGKIPETEMWRTFNMGIGMVLIVEKSEVDKTLNLLTKNGENAYLIGEVVSEQEGVKWSE